MREVIIPVQSSAWKEVGPYALMPQGYVGIELRHLPTTSTPCRGMSEEVWRMVACMEQLRPIRASFANHERSFRQAVRLVQSILSQVAMHLAPAADIVAAADGPPAKGYHPIFQVRAG